MSNKFVNEVMTWYPTTQRIRTSTTL